MDNAQRRFPRFAAHLPVRVRGFSIGTTNLSLSGAQLAWPAATYELVAGRLAREAFVMRVELPGAAVEVSARVVYVSDGGEEMGSEGYPEANVDASYENFLNKPGEPTKFAYHTLFLVAVLFIVKAGTEHMPSKRIVRLMFEWAMEMMNDWLKHGQKAVICSGLVYRAFDEALYHGHAHRYQIHVDNPYVLRPDGHETAPMPSVEWQIEALGDAADAAREFLRGYATSLGLTAAVASNPDAVAHHVYADFVNPADLQRSRNLTRIGRVKREY